jgi:hypothetical protein
MQRVRVLCDPRKKPIPPERDSMGAGCLHDGTAASSECALQHHEPPTSWIWFQLPGFLAAATKRCSTPWLRSKPDSGIFWRSTGFIDECANASSNVTGVKSLQFEKPPPGNLCRHLQIILAIQLHPSSRMDSAKPDATKHVDKASASTRSPSGVLPRADHPAPVVGSRVEQIETLEGGYLLIAGLAWETLRRRLATSVFRGDNCGRECSISQMMMQLCNSSGVQHKWFVGALLTVASQDSAQVLRSRVPGWAPILSRSSGKRGGIDGSQLPEIRSDQ